MKSLALMALLGASACVTPAGGAGRDPSSVNPSQPHPPGEMGYMNAGASPVDAALMTGLAVGASAAELSGYSSRIPRYGSTTSPVTIR